MTNRFTLCSIVSIMASYGLAAAQPVVDGTLSAGDAVYYGSALWVQNIPTGFGDNAGGGTCNQSDIGTPGTVTTGMEFSIPLSAIGNPSGPIRITAIMGNQGHNFLSNQVLKGLPALSDSLGEPRTTDLSAIAGDQYVTATAIAGASPTIDGVLSAGEYPAALALQTNRTSFGNNTDATPQSANGSEFDGIHAMIRNGSLFIFITGNMETNFNKIELFLDTGAAGGYNQLIESATFPDVDFGSLQNLQGFSGMDRPGPGLKFDAAFSATHYITFGCGGSPIQHYPNLADLVNGVGTYLGTVATGSGSGLLDGGNNLGIEIAVDNSNIGGVPERCPPPTGSPDIASGSELDNLFAYLDTQCNNLHVFIGGNLQTNFNKIDLFFDVTGGGQNTLRGTGEVDIDFGALQNMGGNGVDPGLTFDAGFAADYWIGFTNGNNIEVYGNAAVLRTNGPVVDFGGNKLDYGVFDGGQKSSNNPMNFDGPRIDAQDGFTPNIFANYSPRKAGASVQANPLMPVGTPNQILISINNSNIGGVTATEADPVAAEAVRTGLELRINLDELGWNGVDCIKITGMIQNGGHDFMSNQVIGGLPTGSGNLGATRVVNFSNIAGDQFITICPAPVCHGCCVADFDDGTGTGAPDGGVTIEDLLYYLALFDQGASCADVDDGSSTGAPDGGVTIEDLLYYLARFDSGC